MRLASQRGSALISALITVSIVASLAASTALYRWRSIEVETTRRAGLQASWLMTGVFDWARLILSEDAKANRTSAIDHLGEPWAIVVGESKLSTFLSQDQQVLEGDEDLYLSGHIQDEQSKINLRSLFDGDRMSDATFNALKRLFQHLSLDQKELDELVRQLGTMQQAAVGNRPLPATATSGIDWLPLPPTTRDAVRDFLTWLPTKTAVNVNTAPPEVLYAVVPGLDFATANRMAADRNTQPWRNVGEFRLAAGPVGSRAAESLLSVSSDYFNVHATLRLDATSQQQVALMRRQGTRVTISGRRLGQ